MQEIPVQGLLGVIMKTVDWPTGEVSLDAIPGPHRVLTQGGIDEIPTPAQALRTSVVFRVGENF
jgi:hypothetical protein